MTVWRNFSAVILATACLAGCSTQPTGPTAAKSQMPSLTPLDNTSALTEETLQLVEQKYECRLPDDYRQFLLKNNGGFPLPECVTFDEAGRKTAADVFCFLAIGDERPWASMEWNRETYSGRLPKNTLPIARDSGGNLWLLNVGPENTGSVYFWDHGSYGTFDERDLNNWPRVAASFHEFRDKLSAAEVSSKGDGVPSRYALVKQAEAGMVKRDAGFSSRGNPGYVWHCDCDDNGKVKMQFVKYEIHAVATHTCGYSRLLGIKGLIKQGEMRLPE
jgi:hypothetical protein